MTVQIMRPTGALAPASRPNVFDKVGAVLVGAVVVSLFNWATFTKGKDPPAPLCAESYAGPCHVLVLSPGRPRRLNCAADSLRQVYVVIPVPTPRCCHEHSSNGTRGAAQKRGPLTAHLLRA